MLFRRQTDKADIDIDNPYQAMPAPEINQELQYQYDRDLVIYTDSLRLVEGKALPKFQQIRVDLLKALYDEAALVKITDDERNQNLDLVFKIKNKASIVDSADEKIAASVTAKQNHEDHCEALKVGYLDILTKYQDYTQNPTYAGSRWRRLLWKDYTYDGGHQGEEFQNFIALIDRLALIDGSGDCLRLLLGKILEPDKITSLVKFDHKKQAELLDMVNDLFIKIQEAYYAYLAKRDQQYKEQLYAALIADLNKYNHDTTNINIQWVAKYYDYFIYGIGQRPKDYDYFFYGVGQKPEGSPARLGKFLYDLNKIKLKTKPVLEGYEHQLKQLKKDIHHVAQQLELPSKIVKRQHIDKYRSDEEANAHPHLSAPELVNYLSPYEVATNAIHFKHLISEEQQHDRKIKASIKRVALISALICGFGEGLVAAAAFAGAVSALLPLIAAVFMIGVVGLAGWFCNVFLFKNDTNNVLRQFILKKEETRENGEVVKVRLLFHNVTRPWRWAIKGFGLLSIFTGIATGAMSAVYAQAAWTSVWGSLAVTGATWALAAIPAIGTCIGVTCIFFTVIADFIKNKRLKDIKEYFINTYYAPWSEINNWQRFCHILHCGFSIIKLALGIAITTVFTMASFGAFYIKTIELLTKAADWFGKMTSGINSAISLPFTHKNVHQQIHRCLDVGRETYTDLEYKNDQPEVALSPIQKDVRVTQRGKKIFGLCTVFANGIAAQGLVMEAADSQIANKIGINAQKWMSRVSGAEVSIASNEPAYVEAIDKKSVARVSQMGVFKPESGFANAQQLEQETPTYAVGAVYG